MQDEVVFTRIVVSEPVRCPHALCQTVTPLLRGEAKFATWVAHDTPWSPSLLPEGL